jgi:hypothetical protein
MTLLGGREVGVDPETAVGVAMDFELSAYDAQYVAVALALQSVLVTGDRTVLARASAVARSLEAYAQEDTAWCRIAVILQPIRRAASGAAEASWR